MNSNLTELKLRSHYDLAGGKIKNKPPEDDGYAKSESGKSTRSISSKSDATSASTSSGISSTLSVDFIGSFQGNVTRQTHKQINEEIAKPGFRLSFRAQNRARVVNDNDLGYIKFDEIDFLKVHTAEESSNHSGSDWLVQKEFVDKFTWSLSKINVVAVLENSHVPKKEPMLKLTFANVSRKYELNLLYFLWINMDEREIETITNIKNSITIPIYQQTEFYIPVEKFKLSKRYKMVIYYGTLDLLFCKEFAVRLTTRPISTLSLEQIKHYFPEPALRTLDKCQYTEPKLRELNRNEKLLKEKIISYEKLENPSRLNSTNYYTMLKLMLQMEDETDSKRSLRHDQFCQNVKHEYGRRYSLIINNERLEAAINEYTRIWITPQMIRSAELKLNEINMRKYREAVRNRGANDKFILKLPRNKKDRIYGSVVKIQGNVVYFELNEPLSRYVEKTGVKTCNEKYFIRFMSDRTSITLEHRALEYMNTENTSHFFFPSVFAVNVWPTNETQCSSYSGKRLEWTSPDINDEQKTAIINILKGTAYPYPYILYGPPGTGKTKTLVEAIFQIIKNEMPSEYVLVCATSNSACDEVAKRLIDGGMAGTDQVFRLFSKSVLSKDISTIPQCVLNASNLSTGEHYFPTLEMLCTFKVIVCTLTTAGRLSQGKINAQHFSHVFIDEAGSSTETQTLIALSGLCTGFNKIHANIIFAGDPKQLGPLIKSQQAVKMGYGVSMLERLITTNPLYMKNDQTKRFNENYVTQLVCNYRSHESILHVSNELYYDNNLRVCAPIANINWFIGSFILKEPSFPVVFHSVRGQTIKNKNETSPYNLLEIDTAIHYLNRIFRFKGRTIRQTDIGIISPYRKQCEELTERCAKKGWPEIKIGSVEVFQGQEKPIIIVSTVRSNMNNIGFLESKKRLNVLMTRAKCLLIIIGDANTLARDEHWKYVIQYCEKANGMIYH